MSAKHVVIGALIAFFVSVAALSFFGKDMLRSMEQADATISFLDLARQASDSRQYEKANDFYKQAIKYAESTSKRNENLVLALGCYSDFLRNKRNPLKDQTLAKALDERARALRAPAH